MIFLWHSASTQMLSRKQFIEYKLKLAQRPAAVQGADPQQTLSLANKQELTQELQDLTGRIEVSIRDYEDRFGERFIKPTASAAINMASLSGGGGSGGGVGSGLGGGSGIAFPGGSPVPSMSPFRGSKPMLRPGLVLGSGGGGSGVVDGSGKLKLNDVITPKLNVVSNVP